MPESHHRISRRAQPSGFNTHTFQASPASIKTTRGASVNIAVKGIKKLDWNVPVLALDSLPGVQMVRPKIGDFGRRRLIRSRGRPDRDPPDHPGLSDRSSDGIV